MRLTGSSIALKSRWQVKTATRKREWLELNEMECSRDGVLFQICEVIGKSSNASGGGLGGMPTTWEDDARAQYWDGT